MIVMSTIDGVPEAPHLQDRDLEAFRAQWLIIESIAVAGSSVVQICIEVKSLAITTSCQETNTSVRVSLHFLAWKLLYIYIFLIFKKGLKCFSHGNNWKP